MIGKILTFLVVIGLLVGGAYFLRHTFISSSMEETAPLETRAIKQGDITQMITCVGEIEPVQFTDVKSEISGRVVKVAVDSGYKVKKGDVMLELDRKELDSQHEEAEHTIETANLRLRKAQLVYDSKKALRGKNFIPEMEFQEAEIELGLAQNDLKIQQARLRTLEEKLAKTTIMAPHNGVVLNNIVREGMVITGATSFSEGTIMMQVAELSDLEIETYVNEIDVEKLHDGMPVKITLESLPGVKLDGKIVFVSPSASPKDRLRQNPMQRGSSRDMQTQDSVKVFPIKVSFKTEDARVRPGMTANVQVELANSKATLLADLATVFYEDGGVKVAYAKKSDGTWERRQVEVGLSDQFSIEIKGGAKVGEELATRRPEGMAAPKKSSSGGGRYR